jgi:Mrp family chromosome partitioning ATPase
MTDHQPEDAGIREYLGVLRRRKWIFLQAVVLVPAAAVALSVRQAPSYEASSEVVLKYQNLAGVLTGIQDYSTVFQDAERVSETQARLAASPALASRVLAEAGIRDREPVDLLDASSISADASSDVLRFTVTDGEADTVRILATTYAREFIRYRRELDTQPIVLARRGLAERIEELRAAGRERSKLYDTLVESEQQLRTMEALQTANAAVLRLPEAATKIGPTPTRNGVLGLLLGIVLGLGLAFLREALDTRVRSSETVTSALGAPLLGRIPVLPKKRRRAAPLVMLESPDGPYAEAFRVLRTNIEFMNIDRGARILMVTSASEDEGKSTTAANLAIAFARAGRRVALVELDLRRPSLDLMFDLEDVPHGITEVALGHVRLEQALVHIPLGQAPSGNGAAPVGRLQSGRQGSLDLLPAGELPPDPGEFVTSDALARTIRDLGERFDIVLLDVPPLLGVGDALALSAYAEGLIVVTRLKALRRGMLRELSVVLARSPAALLGFVMTGGELESEYGYTGYYAERRPAEREPVA